MMQRGSRYISDANTSEAFDIGGGTTEGGLLEPDTSDDRSETTEELTAVDWREGEGEGGERARGESAGGRLERRSAREVGATVGGG